MLWDKFLVSQNQLWPSLPPVVTMGYENALPFIVTFKLPRFSSMTLFLIQSYTLLMAIVNEKMVDRTRHL